MEQVENKGLSHGLFKHAVDSTAFLSVLNPLCSVGETFIARMSNDTSVNARLLGTALTYGGLGFVYSAGRKASRAIFNVGVEATERVKWIHDTLYLAGYSLALNPPSYYIAGSRDVQEIVVGTAIATGIGLAGGGVVGYLVDTFEDAMGIKESERLPAGLKRQRSAVKKGLVALTVGASVGAMGLVYDLHNRIMPEDSKIQETHSSR